MSCTRSLHFIFISEEEGGGTSARGVLQRVCMEHDSQGCGRSAPTACQRTLKVHSPVCSHVEEGTLGGVLWWIEASPHTLAWGSKGYENHENSQHNTMHHLPLWYHRGSLLHGVYSHTCECSECSSSNMHSMQWSRAITGCFGHEGLINSTQTATVVAFLLIAPPHSV